MQYPSRVAFPRGAQYWIYKGSEPCTEKFYCVLLRDGSFLIATRIALPDPLKNMTIVIMIIIIIIYRLFSVAYPRGVFGGYDHPLSLLEPCHLKLLHAIKEYLFIFILFCQNIRPIRMFTKFTILIFMIDQI